MARLNQSSLFGALSQYPDQFEQFWKEYPSRPGNPKRAAYKQWQRRVDVYGCEVVLDGAKRYRAYCEASEIVGTPFVKMAQTFLGPDLHFLEDWEPPEKTPEWAKLPLDDDDLWPFAKQHGFPNPGSMNYYQYRKALQSCIEKRLAEKK